MKKFLSLVLTLALCLSLAVPALALTYGEEYAGYTTGGTQQYRDVPTTHWAHASIETCSQRTWFNGYPDGTFRPDGLITREEAAKVFAVALGLTLEENPQVTYTDTAGSWAKAYIEATKALFPNVANLQGTSSFRPSQTITREETVYALLVAWRYASKTTNADLSVLNMFSDANSISNGVKPYMAVAVSEGLVSGFPDGTIAAQKGLTRAEFATLLARALNHGYGSDTTDVPTITVNKYTSETTEARLTVSGKVSPLSTGTKLTLDGEAVSLSSSGTFRVTLDLDLGENSFTLASQNTYGVGDSKVVRVTRVEPEPEPEPEPSVTPSPAPSQEPTPSQQPSPSQEPTPSQQPQPSQKPNTQEPTPSQTPSVQEPEPTAKPGQSTQPTEPEREVIRSGKCGSDAKWILYADGEMVITGTGRMNYFGYSIRDRAPQRPWDNFADQITSVTIENGITNVGWHAFSGIKSLTKVTIADSVTDIGICAFQGTALVSVVVPNRVNVLREGAFHACNNLTKITLPHSLESIHNDVFDGCNRLTDVYYAGTALDWGDIDVLENNAPLDEVTIHYNSTGN